MDNCIVREFYDDHYCDMVFILFSLKICHVSHAL